MSANEFKDLAIEISLLKETLAIYERKGQENGYTYSMRCKLASHDVSIKHNTYFWFAMGVDQAFHGLTDLFIVYVIFTNL
jgi:hypothetical protein